LISIDSKVFHLLKISTDQIENHQNLKKYILILV